MLIVSDEIKKRLYEKKGVVALESTIITHGMPYPQNLETAILVERTIRENGAVPALIAIIDGVIRVGLSNDELEQFAKNKDAIKVSKRDLAYVVSQKKTGSTTVSATMLIAEMAGIEVFATGGIGGVHRSAQQTFDISRDLEELGSTNVTVVCAGAKSILDLGLTLEYLETKGVEVIGYKTKVLPAFYSKESKFEVNYSLNSTEEIAELIRTKRKLNLTGGILVTVPIPDESSMDSKKIDEVIDKSISIANGLGIKGKDITPFLLDKIKTLTSGKSLDANIILIKNNAKLAAEIAVKLSDKM